MLWGRWVPQNLMHVYTHTRRVVVGGVSIDQMVEGLKKLGFDVVFDTNFAADLTVRGGSAGLCMCVIVVCDHCAIQTHTHTLCVLLVCSLYHFHTHFNTQTPTSTQIMEEGSELLARMKGEPGAGPLPMFTSCCPGTIGLVVALSRQRWGCCVCE